MECCWKTQVLKFANYLPKDNLKRLTLFLRRKKRNWSLNSYHEVPSNIQHVHIYSTFLQDDATCRILEEGRNILSGACISPDNMSTTQEVSNESLIDAKPPLSPKPLPSDAPCPPPANHDGFRSPLPPRTIEVMSESEEIDIGLHRNILKIYERIFLKDQSDNGDINTSGSDDTSLTYVEPCLERNEGPAMNATYNPEAEEIEEHGTSTPGLHELTNKDVVVNASVDTDPDDNSIQSEMDNLRTPRLRDDIYENEENNRKRKSSRRRSRNGKKIRLADKSNQPDDVYVVQNIEININGNRSKVVQNIKINNNSV